MKNKVIHSDNLKLMKLLDNNTIDLTFTSPPYYNARSYSTYSTYDEYLKYLTTLFNMIHAITKEGKFLIVNTSPVIEPRISRSHSSIRYPIPFDLTYILTRNGWDFIDDIIWKKPEYSVKNRIGSFMQHRKPLAYKPNQVTEYIMVYRKKTKKLIDWNIKQYDNLTINNSKIFDEVNTTNIWEIMPKHDKNHPAVFPIELCNNILRYYSYENDVILDPFAGSGTLGVACEKMNRKYILIEKNNEYVEYMKTKLKDFEFISESI